MYRLMWCTQYLGTIRTYVLVGDISSTHTVYQQLINDQMRGDTLCYARIDDLNKLNTVIDEPVYEWGKRFLSKMKKEPEIPACWKWYDDWII